MVPKPFKKYYNGGCSHSTFFMLKAKTITQIRPDDRNKGSKPKVILLPTPRNSILKYLIIYYYHIFQKLKCF